ncbi:hypothetical protein HED55_20530 [Ochrobactrum haematophilum]|uniref:Uncharacterized protein n=1 Tax=Brucella haematophila TaxID=419474 RepID=A0ABX1DP54_9HYPH|nr:hypothetical protein [Brucella haematophila]
MSNLAALLNAEPRYVPFSGLRDIDALAGWGRSLQSRFAERLATYWGLPFLALEDGFCVRWNATIHPCRSSKTI